MNARFSDYVTSGAFALALTRSQISALALVAGGESRYLGPAASLERKGLIEAIAETLPDNPHMVDIQERTEWRLTAAGALVLQLLHQAGLSNSGAGAAARELDDLRGKLSAANSRTRDAYLRVKSMHARLGKAEEEIARLKAAANGEKIPFLLVPRDWLPDTPTEALLDPEADIGEPRLS